MGTTASCHAAGWAFVLDLARSKEPEIDCERVWWAARSLACERYHAGLRDQRAGSKALGAAAEEVLQALGPLESPSVEAEPSGQHLTITQLDFLELLRTRTLCVVQLPACVPDEVYVVRIRQHAHREKASDATSQTWALSLATHVQWWAVVLEAGEVVSVEAPPGIAVFNLERWCDASGSASPRLLLMEQEIKEYCGPQACDGVDLSESTGVPSWDLSRATSRVGASKVGMNDPNREEAAQVPRGLDHRLRAHGTPR